MLQRSSTPIFSIFYGILYGIFVNEVKTKSDDLNTIYDNFNLEIVAKPSDFQKKDSTKLTADYRQDFCFEFSGKLIKNNNIFRF